MYQYTVQILNGIIDDMEHLVHWEPLVFKGSEIYFDHVLVITQIDIIFKWKKRLAKNPKRTEDIFNVHL